jgi:cellulose biosynthesis protein BcsQ
MLNSFENLILLYDRMIIMIVTVASHKGGVGKTTIASLILYSWLNSTDSRPIVAVDIDPQKNFSDRTTGLKQIISTTTLAQIQSKDSRRIIIDTPPGATSETIRAVQIADILLVPAELDKHSAQGAIAVMSIREGLAFIILNRFIPSTRAPQRQRVMYNYYEQLFPKHVLTLPHSPSVVANMDYGDAWDIGVRRSLVKEILSTLQKSGIMG